MVNVCFCLSAVIRSRILVKSLDKGAGMARKVRDRELGDRASRAKLKPRGKPYWRTLDQGVHIGYRKNPKAGGKWVGRVYRKGAAEPYITHTLPGVADDKADANNVSVYSFYQAQEQVRQWAAEQHRGVPAAQGPTVSDAVDKYEADLAVRQGDAGNVRRVRRHLPAALLGRAVVELEADELRSWRDGLTKSLAAATVNRVITVLGAALNHLADLDHRVAANRQSWRSGLKAIAGAARANNVILPNAVVAKLVETAAEFGDDFHRLVWVEAETGARYSQVVKLAVKDLLDRRGPPRILMPRSKKGRGQKQMSHTALPITPALAADLRLAAAGRPPREPLLLHAGEPWKAARHLQLFARTVKAAGLDSTITSYSLRHSSICRQLLSGVPTRIVAVNHDTSTIMLERVYSAHIGDHADALTRAALLDVSQPPAELTVVSGRP